ncbi:lipocalin-like domain-containing protein [Raineyella fluvialis]|nr:lipocalin-like domain-containing protein [Raineyella fluvialis]
MTESLRDQLIGAWKLVSHVERPVDGGADRYPMGEHPQGIILYTPDGYMSAQLMTPGRPAFASGDWFDATDEEVRAEAPARSTHSSSPPHIRCAPAA